MSNGRRGPESSEFRDLDGLPQDRQSMFEQRFADIDRRRRDLEAMRSREGETYSSGRSLMEGARDTAVGGAETAALMPVYSMMGKSGLAGAYSGGGTQAASQAAMQGAIRAGQVGSTYADRLVQMDREQMQRESEMDAQASTIEEQKTILEKEAFEEVDAGIEADIQGMRDENYMDINYVGALLNAAKDAPRGSRARLAFLDQARRIAQDDWATRTWLRTTGRDWARFMQEGSF